MQPPRPHARRPVGTAGAAPRGPGRGPHPRGRTPRRERRRGPRSATRARSWDAARSSASSGRATRRPCASPRRSAPSGPTRSSSPGGRPTCIATRRSRPAGAEGASGAGLPAARSRAAPPRRRPAGLRRARGPGRRRARAHRDDRRHAASRGSRVSASTWRGRSMPKCLRSSVASFGSPSRSVTASTAASTKPMSASA